jgi:hypothetical protein
MTGAINLPPPGVPRPALLLITERFHLVGRLEHPRRRWQYNAAASPNDDDDDDEDEDGDAESDEDEPAVIREPDEQ